MIVGVDEAGRGCVIGPMVIAIAIIDPLQEYKLKEMGVRDSKELEPKRRRMLYKEVRKICKTKNVKISAKEITKLMDEYSLNDIEAMKIAKLLKDAKAEAAYIDSPDNVPKNFEKRIMKFSKNKMKMKLVCENKADKNHPIVAAASIIAKVQRDREIEKIKKIVGYDFNSGYTSDIITISFLEKHANDGEVKPYLRHKWKTLQRLRQKKLGDF
ncbi:MAG: ribonuclease HII [Candidatus Micrarchaeota archaeon]